jgi:pseudouridine synthase
MPARNRQPFNERDLRDASRGQRLQRVLADAGVASRRACEDLIRKGAVEVNGQVVTELPAWVDPHTDRIRVEGRPIPKPERHLYLMLNKPTRTLTSAADEPGSDRRTVLDLVDHPAKARLFPVGRLDYDTVGLLLLTNDGELANRLTHPRFGAPKTYRVVVRGRLDQDAAKEIERGIYLAERKAGRTVGAVRTAHVELTVLKRDREKTTLELTLREGRNRQVRRMLAAVGFPVKSLERVGMGPLRLKGVPRGAWRELTAAEIKALRRAAAVGDQVTSTGKSSRRGAKKSTKPSPGGKPGRPRAEEEIPGTPVSRRRIKDAAHGRPKKPRGGDA